jgi:hypothetical protein
MGHPRRITLDWLESLLAQQTTTFEDSKGFGKKDLSKNCAVILPGCKALRVGNMLIASISKSPGR